jgi:hypothetical protein
MRQLDEDPFPDPEPEPEPSDEEFDASFLGTMLTLGIDLVFFTAAMMSVTCSKAHVGFYAWRAGATPRARIAHIEGSDSLAGQTDLTKWRRDFFEDRGWLMWPWRGLYASSVSSGCSFQ